MAFRTLEITRPAELHVNRSQLQIDQEEGRITVPIEDLASVVCTGPGIRIPTLAQAILAKAGVSLMILDEKYHPAAVLTPVNANVRHALVSRGQIAMDEKMKQDIWRMI